MHNFMSDAFYKLPRLYSHNPVQSQGLISLDGAQAHYLKNVMRRQLGDCVRVFDGTSGEVLARITALDKKRCDLEVVQTLRSQPLTSEQGRVHLLFAPLAKNRMDMVIEKAIELGVTDLHPVLTHRTEHRKLKTDRLEAQIIEATEQSERLTCARLYPLADLKTVLARWDGPLVQWCCERDDLATARKQIGYNTARDQAFLVGPVGGFDPQECDDLAALACVQPISLGDNILRAETASILCLSAYALQGITLAGD